MNQPTSAAVLEPEQFLSASPEQTASLPSTSTPQTPSLTPQRQLLRSVAVMTLLVACTALLQLVVVGRLQHSAAQQRLFDRFRSALAEGTAPVGGFDQSGAPLREGVPVAYLEIPSLGLRQVVVEGTRSSVLAAGPGHRPDTVLPGQFGTSMVFGRRAMFGGPFSGIRGLAKGDAIKVTTAQGEFNYRVIGVRREGDPMPSALAPNGSRLTLATADGAAYFPNGVLRVDADLEGTAVGGGPRQVSSATLPAEDQAMSGDSSTAWALVLWLQALVLAAAAFAWAWRRWSRIHAWVVFIPLLLLISLLAWGEAARFLPNLA